jgi:hypothetical protein
MASTTLSYRLEVERRVRAMVAIEAAKLRRADDEDVRAALLAADGPVGFTDLGRWIGTTAASAEAAEEATKHVVWPLVKSCFSAAVAAAQVRANSLHRGMSRLRAARDAVLEQRRAAGALGGMLTRHGDMEAEPAQQAHVNLHSRAEALVVQTRGLLQAVHRARLDALLTADEGAGAADGAGGQLRALEAAHGHLVAALVEANQAASLITTGGESAGSVGGLRAPPEVSAVGASPGLDRLGTLASLAVSSVLTTSRCAPHRAPATVERAVSNKRVTFQLPYDGQEVDGDDLRAVTRQQVAAILRAIRSRLLRA